MPPDPSYDTESTSAATSGAAEAEARNVVADLYSLPELLKSLGLTDQQRHDRMLAFALTVSKEATLFEHQVAEMPISNRPHLYVHFASQLKTYFDEMLPDAMPDMDKQVMINFNEASLQMSKIMSTARGEDTEEFLSIGDSTAPISTFCSNLQNAMNACLKNTNVFDAEMDEEFNALELDSSENGKYFAESSPAAATRAAPTYVKDLFIKLKDLEDSSNALSLSDEERNRRLNTLAWAVHSVTTAFESDMVRIDSLPFAWMDHLLTELKTTFARLSEIPDIDGETEMLFNAASRQMADLVARFDGGYISEGAIATAPNLNELMDALCWNVQSAVTTFLGNTDELDVVMADAEADIKRSGSRSQDSTDRGSGDLGKGIPLNKEIQKWLTRGIPRKNIKPCKTVREVLSVLDVLGTPLWEQKDSGEKNQQKDMLITATNTDIDAFVGERELIDVFKDFDSFVEFRNGVAGKKKRLQKYAWTTIGLAFYNPPLIAWAKKHVSPPLTKTDVDFLFELAIFLTDKKHNFEEMTPEKFCTAFVEMITTPPIKTSFELSGALTTLRQKILPYGLFEQLSKTDETFTKDTSASQTYRNAVLKIEAYLMAKPLSYAEYVRAPEDYKHEITEWWKKSFMRNPKGVLHSNIQTAINNVTKFAKTFDETLTRFHLRPTSCILVRT